MANDGFIAAGGGARLYYRVAGEGTQAVIVPLECWTTELDRLADGRRILYFDPRGRGQSSPATDLAALSYRQDVEDLDCVRRCGGGSPRASAIGIGAKARAWRRPPRSWFTAWPIRSRSPPPRSG
jgi:pimeloyl-ACP methyl ester carboxylesterase